MSEKSIPTEISESGPTIPESGVVVSPTLTTGPQNTFGAGGTDRLLARDCKAKADAEKNPLPRVSRPPHPFSPEIVYFSQQMKEGRCTGRAEPPGPAGLAARGFARPGVQGRVRVHQKVLRVLAQRPLASSSGVRACEQRRRSKTQHRAAKSAPAKLPVWAGFQPCLRTDPSFALLSGLELLVPQINPCVLWQF